MRQAMRQAKKKNAYASGYAPICADMRQIDKNTPMRQICVQKKNTPMRRYASICVSYASGALKKQGGAT